MKLIRPRSFLNLVTGGLIVVLLPLIVGLFTTRNHLDKLVSQSVELIEHSISATRDAQNLSEFTKNQERNTRLFDIVGEVRYLEEVSLWQDKIYNLLKRLQQLPVEQSLLNLLLEYHASEGRMLEYLQLAHHDPEAHDTHVAEAIHLFSVLDKQAKLINIGINEFIDSELANLKTSKLVAQETLLWQTLSFIILTVVMILILALIISQPIKQIYRSIDRLGKGDFSTPVLITGPKDLETLGSKINWLRKRLAILERQKTKFIAHISHDLKTPLTSIMEGSCLLQEELVGSLNKQQLAVVEILTKNSVKLQKLINNILDFNMAQAGDNPKCQTDLALKPLIEQAASEQTTQMLAKNISLDLHLKETTILGNKSQIETIFDNLFSNAVKFSPNGGIVCCNLRQTDREVKCIISNTGPIIPLKERDKIFTPFYQVTNNDSNHTQGSGLGLAIVKEYVSQHNGTISVLDHTSGGQFMVAFPLTRNEQSTTRPA
jgi:two-component system sensor histidine kinase GlrK